MTATQNNFLGPAALIFSCCFPAKNGWESESCGLGATHELSHTRAISNDEDGGDQTISRRICGCTDRVFGMRIANRLGTRTLHVF